MTSTSLNRTSAGVIGKTTEVIITTEEHQPSLSAKKMRTPSESSMSLQEPEIKGATQMDGPVLNSLESELPAESAPSVKSTSTPEEDESKYPTMRKAILIAVALFLAMFLVSLDRTIVATAIPVMTDDFHSFGDIGWYGSAYMLTLCTFQLIFGRIYGFYNPKTIFQMNVIIFEIGSAICGAAPNSTTFIVGRAIAGIGSSGIMSGTLILITNIVPLRKRPMFMGVLGACFGLSSVAGPLLGGIFTSDLSWRWCFYINLPIGAVAFLVIIFLLKIPENAVREKLPIRKQLQRLDPVGTFFFMPGIVCLLLALEWGGATYAWSSWRVILLLTIFSLCTVCFLFVQRQKGETATVPPRLIRQRSILACLIYTTGLGASLFLVLYYLPTWLQAIKGISAVRSGIYTIPLVAAIVVGAILGGAFVQRVGYYSPIMIASGCIGTVGAGVFLIFTPATSKPVYLGLQAVYGFGIGLGMQQAMIAVQTVLPHKDVPIGLSVIFLGQSLSAAVFLAVGQNVLDARLIRGLAALNLPDFNPADIVRIGATELRSSVPVELLPEVLVAYNAALMDVFKVATGMTAVMLVAALAVEWKSVKGMKKGGSPVKGAVVEEGEKV